MKKKASKKFDFSGYLNQLIRNAAVKAAFSKLITKLGWSATGFQGWLANFIVNHAYDYIAKPLVGLVIRKGMLVYDKVDGNFKLKKINKAKDENDTDTYWDTLSDI